MNDCRYSAVTNLARPGKLQGTGCRQMRIHGLVNASGSYCTLGSSSRGVGSHATNLSQVLTDSYRTLVLMTVHSWSFWRDFTQNINCL